MARRGERPADVEPLPVAVVDGHTHLEVGVEADAGAAPDVPALLARAAAAGVPRAVQVGCDPDAVAWTLAAVEAHAALVGGVAVHPTEASRLHGEGALDGALAQVAEAARHPRVRVVGETGLDAYWVDRADLSPQVEAFRWHVALAKELDLPLQIHDRDAHDEVLEVLHRDGAPARTVFHCFSGDRAMAEHCAENGWYLSFAGPLTFRNGGSLREAARVVPQGLLQVETDAPYLTPHPHRGRPNASYLLPLTVRALAEVREEPLDALCAALAATAEDLYGPW